MRGIVAATAAACLLSFGEAVTGAHATDRLPAPCDGSWKYPKPIPRSDGYTLNDVAAVGQKDV